VDDTIEIDLREEDIKMDVFRASGAGGQHVNKTSSPAADAPSDQHGSFLPAGAESDEEPATAMKMLGPPLPEEIGGAGGARAVIEATKTDNSWGNQIRSYVFQPYTMVNDHRTEVKWATCKRVMDGDLDEFIQAYLKRFGGKAA
jgi:peptide chain release factor 2